MTEQTTPNGIMDDAEREILLQIHGEAYEHVRHAEQMRATYLNHYLTIVGIGITAWIAIFEISKSSVQPIPKEWPIALGLVIWGMGILTVMRAERWSGHITHDLRVVRQIHSILGAEHPLVHRVVPERQGDLLAGIAFRRTLTDRNKDISPLAGMLGALVGIGIVAFELPAPDWIRISVGVLGALFAFVQQQEEIVNLEERHRHCCLGSKELPRTRYKRVRDAIFRSGQK
jgi:hypothetical protein